MENDLVFENKIRAFCRQKELFARGDRVLLGLSGGADSVCLFRVLLILAKDWELALVPVHVNHNLRGGDALADQQFCEELCRMHGLCLQVVSENVAALAADRGWSLEEAGRNVRYEAFHRLADEWQCNKIAVAHHKDDQAETVLFQLFRGSRLKGLSGMEAKNGKVVRPLLAVTREEIEAYLEKNQQNFCIDCTNLEEEYTRNKIRHRIVPAAKEVCAGAVEHITGLAEYAGAVEELLKRLTEALFDACADIDKENNVTLQIEALRHAERVLADRVIYEALCLVYGRKKDITAGFVADCYGLMEKQTGRFVTLPEGRVARREFQTLYIGKAQAPTERLEQAIQILPFSERLPFLGKKLVLSVENRVNLPEKIPKSSYTKWFDYDKINKVMSLKTLEAGDEIIIYADGRKKRLADIFAEAKIPREHRSMYPVLAAGKEILWVPGIRGSEGYRVTKETKQVLIATIDGGNENGT